MKYVYHNAKTGKKETSDTPLTGKHLVLVRQVGKVINKA